MEEFEEELIDAIVEVSIETEISAKECIETAVEMLEKEKKPKKENYIDSVANQIFGEW